MASRDPKLLHAPLREGWQWMQQEWKRRWGDDAPQPFLTCTYRSPDEQDALVERGVSRARAGQSLHNYSPAYAFDVAFDDKPQDGVGNDVTWEWLWYERWGALAKEVGLVWGGDWQGLRDGPHVQMPMTWRDAKAGDVPTLPPLPVTKEDIEVLERDFADAHITVLELPDFGAVVAALELIAEQQAETNKILRERL